MNSGLRTPGLLAIALASGLAGCSADGSETRSEGAAPEEGVPVTLIYLDHPPVASAVRENVDPVLDAYADQVIVTRVDAESEEGGELADEHDLGDHVPLSLLLDGQSTVEVDGRGIEFAGFPEGASPFPDAEGQWTAEDLDAALARLTEAP